MAALAEILAGLDPETAGAVASSNAMQPAVDAHFQGLAQQLADWGQQQDAMKRRLAGQPLSQQVLDPEALQSAMSIALSTGPGAMETPAQKIMRLNDLTARNDMDLVKQGADNFFQNHTSGQIIPAYDAQGNSLPSGQPQGIRAYHGSPYDFDAFDASKIGTGEGAQTYGHGMYFSEEPNVAQQYRNKLADRPEVLVGGEPQPFGPSAFNNNTADQIAAARISSKWHALSSLGHQPQIEDIVSEVQNEIGNGIESAAQRGDFPVFESLTNQKTALSRMMDRGIDVKPSGKMYEVNINADPAQFLNWDKPLSEQSGAVRSALEPLYGDVTTRPIGTNQHSGDNLHDLLMNGQSIGAFPESALRGQDLTKLAMSHDPRVGKYLYEDVARQVADPHPNFDVRSPYLASQTLNQSGIPGIRYLDQGSRGAGDGTSNYVVFNPKIIDIVRKYGLAGLMASGAVASGLPDQK